MLRASCYNTHLSWAQDMHIESKLLQHTPLLGSRRACWEQSVITHTSLGLKTCMLRASCYNTHLSWAQDMHVESNLLQHTPLLGSRHAHWEQAVTTHTSLGLKTCTLRAICYNTHLSWAQDMHIESKLLQHTPLLGSRHAHWEQAVTTHTSLGLKTCTLRASCYNKHLSWAQDMHIESKLLQHTPLLGSRHAHWEQAVTTHTSLGLKTCMLRASCYNTHLSWAQDMHIESKLL